MLKITLFALLVSLVSCTTNPLTPNYSLLQPWSPEGQSSEPHKVPFVAIYERGGKQLWFIAANHVNSIDSPTFKTIDKAINKLNPEVLILEGFPNKGEVSPKWYVEYAQECSKKKFQICGEPAYSAYLSEKRKIPFVAGEPTDRSIYQELNQLGYSAKDLAGFYLVRQIPQLNRQKRLDNKTFPTLANKLLDRFYRGFGVEKDLDHEGFLKWYPDKSGKKLKIFDIQPHEVAPINHPGASYFQKISYQVGIVREKHILKITSEQLQKYDRVMIIYGAGHHVKQKHVLQEMFGPPKFNKLF